MENKKLIVEYNLLYNAHCTIMTNLQGGESKRIVCFIFNDTIMRMCTDFIKTVQKIETSSPLKNVTVNEVDIDKMFYEQLCSIKIKELFKDRIGYHLIKNINYTAFVFFCNKMNEINAVKSDMAECRRKLIMCLVTLAKNYLEGSLNEM